MAQSRWGIAINLELVLPGFAAKHLVIIENQHFGLRVLFQEGIGCRATCEPRTDYHQVIAFTGVGSFIYPLGKVTVAQGVSGIDFPVGIAVGWCVIALTAGTRPAFIKACERQGYALAKFEAGRCAGTG